VVGLAHQRQWRCLYRSPGAAGDTNADTNRDSDGDCDCNSHRDSHCYCNGNAYGNSNNPAKDYANAKTASHSAAETVGIFAGAKFPVIRNPFAGAHGVTRPTSKGERAPTW